MKIKKPVMGYAMKALDLDDRQLSLFRKIAKEQDRSLTGQVRHIVKQYINTRFPGKH